MAEEYVSMREQDKISKEKLSDMERGHLPEKEYINSCKNDQRTRETNE